MAADAAVDRAYVSELEREQGNATIDLLDRLAAVLDVEVGEFLAAVPQGSEKISPLLAGRKPRRQ